MTWNYRVVRHKAKNHAGAGIEWLSIHEVYYQGDKIESWVVTEAAPLGETYEDLMKDMAALQRAFELPILNAADLPQ